MAKAFNWWRWLQFFEGENGRLSMTRLLMFLAFFPSSKVLLDEADEAMMGWYLGAFVLGYVGGKGADIFAKKGKKNVVAD